MMKIYGVDVSSHNNGSVGFNRLKAEGNSFVILRAGYGWSMTQKDELFDQNYEKAKKAGLKVGAYWYSYARTVEEGLKEAECFLSVVKGKQFEMPLYIDMEDADHWKRMNGCPSGADQARIANAFMEKVSEAGYLAGIYSSTSWFDGYLEGLSDKYERWEANWGSDNGQLNTEVDAPMHQFTSAYWMDGKRFDRNVCKKDYEQIVKAKGLNGYEKQEVDPEMASISEFYKRASGKAWDKYGKTWNVAAAGGAECNFCGQCVSLIKAYLLYLFPGKVRDSYGDAKDYWYNRKSSGILELCKEVGSMKDGDIVITTGSDPQYGHIWIYYQAQAFTQNCASNPRATLYPISWQGDVIGILRPKLSSNGLTLESEHRIAKVKAPHNINIRCGSPNGKIIRTAKPGTEIEYTEKCVTDKHRYISWMEDGKRLYMAVTPTPKRENHWVTISKLPDSWNANGIVTVGCTVKSGPLSIAPFPGTNSCIKGDLVNVPALGGGVPLAHVSEADNTGDGKKDGYLSSEKARVILDPAVVTAVDQAKDLCQIHGYWVKCGPLLVKE